ncbi:tryptophan synthase subunit beta [Tepidibacillus sp. HK-1]|uniref:tryptophan synthase subunit beta n=1 Tax=Tepidibacillus sp. HK-1 TaxID=1883407 RepID=UPI00085395F3|nr:tryptophan synthase subunit beta [Tepidibacillus sp. HK-1]GBF10379.1 tryptophan synthase beta chain [Tepidibacillus sp. HK-1]
MINPKEWTVELDNGRFGDFGGTYIPETLMHAVKELEATYQEIREDEAFKEEYLTWVKMYAGRPTLLYYADKLSESLGGAKIYLKREDLNHTGAHKINNAIGQGLLAKRMGKTKIIAETGAGQHGVASATIAARLGLECKVFMGAEDIERQKLNVFRMQLLGAEVVPVHSGRGTLKDATNEAIRYWAAHVEDTHYLIGSVVGPHPYPTMVRDFQKVIGIEARQQMLGQEGRLPDVVIASVGGGSNAIGIFHPFIEDEQVQLIGVEAAGKGLDSEHAATLTKGKPGIIHGAYTYLLQDKHGMIQPAYSISAGLDYPGVGPEHAYLQSSRRATYTTITDEEAMNALKRLSQEEGIIPAIESAHAVAQAIKLAPTLKKENIILVNLSGRGDKDMNTIHQFFTEEGVE